MAFHVTDGPRDPVPVYAYITKNNKGETYDNNNNYTHHCDKEHDIILSLHNRRHEIATPIATLLLNYEIMLMINNHENCIWLFSACLFNFRN